MADGAKPGKVAGLRSRYICAEAGAGPGRIDAALLALRPMCDLSATKVRAESVKLNFGYWDRRGEGMTPVSYTHLNVQASH